MASLPPSVPYIDLLMPPGAGPVVEQLQTRLELMGAGAWRTYPSDATLEQMAPLQPLEPGCERMALGRLQQWNPREPMDIGAQLAVELALSTQARMTALSVSGTFAWAMVVAEDARWIHGLLLMDWLYNPRISSKGEAFEGTAPEALKAELAEKLRVFRQIWTPERSAAFAKKLPAGALQEIEGYVALMLLSPQGTFDPRYWQSFALQVAVKEVRDLHAQSPKEGVPSPAAQAVPGAAAAGPAEGGAPSRAAAPRVPSAAAAPSKGDAGAGDGLSALARAQVEAERRAKESAGQPEQAPPSVVDENGGPGVRWSELAGSPMLWVPEGRLEASDLRELRGGDHALLRRSERPEGDVWERWIGGGAAFATEVPVLSRLFVDGVPVHRGSWEAMAQHIGGFSVAECQLPRVAPVRVVVVPAEGDRPRRVLATSVLDLSPTALVRLADAS